MRMAKRSRVIRKLINPFLLLSLLIPATTLAETAVLEIKHLPLQEAENIVKSQLSPSGNVSSMVSRSILVVNDRASNIERAKALLTRLDIAARQYSAYLELITLQHEANRSISTSARLPGGWVRINMASSKTHISNRKSYNLYLTSGSEGTIESGTIQPYRQQTKQWLAGYGVIRSSSVELVPITSGFHATVRPAGDGLINVRITPWMRSLRGNRAIQGNSEMMIDLGAANQPRQPPKGTASVRLNTTPPINQNRVIEMAGATTEITMPVGETVTIAAASEEAAQLGNALLLSSSSATDMKSFAIRLKVDQR